MVILLKQHAPQAEQERLLAWLRELGAEVRVTGTPERPFFCLTGDISRIDPSLAARFPAVEDVLRLTEPYPLCSRRLHPEPTVVSVGGARFGGGNFGLIAGPCAVESEDLRGVPPAGRIPVPSVPAPGSRSRLQDRFWQIRSAGPWY